MGELLRAARAGRQRDAAPEARVTAVTAEPTHPSPEPDDGEFTRAVIKLFDWNMSADPQKRALTTSSLSVEARQCANGLALIKQLLNEFMRQNTLTGNDIAETGIGDAYAIVDHLISGKAHPIARHIRGLGAAGLRAQRAQANDFTRLTQRIVVGAARALQTSDRVGIRVATRAIANGLSQGNSEFRPTAAQIKAWHYLFESWSDIGPDVFAREIIERSGIRGTSKLDEGLRFIIEYTKVASPVV
jgi:hypothetical protein